MSESSQPNKLRRILLTETAASDVHASGVSGDGAAAKKPNSAFSAALASAVTIPAAKTDVSSTGASIASSSTAKVTAAIVKSTANVENNKPVVAAAAAAAVADDDDEEVYERRALTSAYECYAADVLRIRISYASVFLSARATF
jgi:hypothetical protein